MEEREPSATLGSMLLLAGIVAVIGFFAQELVFFGTKDIMAVLFAGLLVILAYFIAISDITFGLALIVLGIGFSPEFDVLGVPNIRFEDLVIPAVFLAWMTSRLRSRDELQRNLLSWPMALMIIVMGVSTLLAAGGDRLKYPTRSFFVFGKFIEYFLLYVIVLNTPATFRHFKTIATFCILAGAASVFYTFAFWYLKSGTVRATGPYGETSNIYGGYVLMNIMMVVGSFSVERAFGRRFGKAIITILLLTIFLYTVSRTGYISLAVALLFGALIFDMRILFFACIGSVIFFLIAPEAMLGRMSEILNLFGDKPPSAYAARLDSWEDIMGAWVNNPVFFFFGRGCAYYNLADADNEYMRVLGDSGALGVLVLLTMLLVLFVNSFSELRKTQSARDDESFASRGYLVGYCMLLVLVAVHCIGATTLSAIRPMECFIVYSALANWLINYRRRKNEHSPVENETVKAA